MPANFEKNIFINCPFDKEYYSLLRPLLFTIIYFNYNPRIALESFDSGQARLSKIIDLIKESKYSIHDLSRIRSKKKGEFYRLNMPFELGLDIGSRNFSTKLECKKCMILEAERYRYSKALSDMAGSDIKNHDNDPSKIIRSIRNWFIESIGLKNIVSPTVIWYKFNDFMSDFYSKRKNEGFSDEDLDMMPVPEFIEFINSWLKN